MLRTTFPSFSERFFPNSFFSVLFLIVSDSTPPFSSSHNGSKTRNSVPLCRCLSACPLPGQPRKHIPAFSFSHNGSETCNSVPLWNIVSNAVFPQRKCRDPPHLRWVPSLFGSQSPGTCAEGTRHFYRFTLRRHCLPVLNVIYPFLHVLSSRNYIAELLHLR